MPHIFLSYTLGKARRGAALRWWTINHEFYRPFHPRAFIGNGAILFCIYIQSRRLDGLKSSANVRAVRTLREFSGIINAWNLEFSPRSKQTERKKVSERKEWRRKEFDFRWHDICTIFDRACVSKGEESSIFLWKRVTFNRNLICNLVSPFLSLFACHFFLLFSLLFFFSLCCAASKRNTRKEKRERWAQYRDRLSFCSFPLSFSSHWVIVFFIYLSVAYLLEI